MLTRRAATPATSRTPEVGGTKAHETCIHAPNLPHTRGWGHQCPRDVHPCPQPQAHMGAWVPSSYWVSVAILVRAWSPWNAAVISSMSVREPPSLGVAQWASSSFDVAAHHQQIGKAHV